ncbi:MULTISPECIES: hypothetical protein [unclassified Pedobacter]|uniref:hypothetical protein n=1 Tax=unclassified Pedobacter TaxID=2628915 RepID=UPI002034C03C|nr:MULTISPECIES: hypothetical protein [unclassified Pedobacter]
MKRAFIFFFLILSSSFCCAQDFTIPLYQGQVPNAKRTPADYIEETDSNSLIKNVSIPTMQAYFPDKNKANGTAVIIFPGGGYFVLAPKKCIEIAKAFSALGGCCFCCEVSFTQR